MARWSEPPPVDETGRLTPQARARAKRRVLRSLTGLIVAAVLAGLLAYACDRRPTSSAQPQPPHRVTYDTIPGETITLRSW